MNVARNVGALSASVVVLALAVACSDHSSSPEADETVLLSVIPRGGAEGVDPNTPVIVEFSHPMMQGMEEYADVHEGDADGPLVPGAWSWSSDRTTLTFSPNVPFEPGTRYVIHIGGGMRDGEGHLVDCGEYGLGLGGQWMTQQMAEGGHHGYGGGMMGGGGMMEAGWSHPTNGSYGMVFAFTTA